MSESTIRRAVYLIPDNDKKIEFLKKELGIGYSATMNYVLNRIQLNKEDGKEER
jgi:hypothetical protein